MTDTSREAVERLLDGVTPGPWVTVKSDVYPEGECDSWVTIGRQNFDAVALIVNEHIKDDPELKANANFIAAARELVPALLARAEAAEAAEARIEALTAERDALKAALNFMRGCIIHARTELAQSSQDMSAIRAERALARATLAEIKGESHE